MIEPGQPPDPLIDTLVADRYRVVKRLGEGGMGEVYLAMHEAIEKKVALKVLRPEFSQKADIVTRFQQEAISASRIKHPNVLEIFDFGQLETGAFYLAMEFLEGHDLADELQRVHVMAPADGVRIALQICRALAAAHKQGVVHRDMKPENVFLQRVADGEEVIKIVDFGIAQLRTTEEAEKQQPTRRRLTKTGMIFGTPEYMSPEQAAGKKADQRVDIYATGIIMYEMFTGAVPFTGETFMAVLSAHLNETPPPMRSLVPDLSISPELEGVVMRALEKKPDARFQTMGELMQAIVMTPEGAGLGPATRQLSEAPLSALAYQPGQPAGAVTGHQFGAVGAAAGPHTAAQFTAGAADVSGGYAPPPTAAAGSPYTQASPGQVPPYPGHASATQGQFGAAGRTETRLDASTTRPPERQRSWLGWVVGGGLLLVAAGAFAVVVVLPKNTTANQPAPAAEPSVTQAPVVSAAPAATPSAAPVEPPKPTKLTLKITTQPEGAVIHKGGFQVCATTPCDLVLDPDEAVELTATKGALKGSEKVLAQRDGQPVVIQLKGAAIAPRPQPSPAPGPAPTKMCEVEVDGLKILRPCP